MNIDKLIASLSDRSQDDRKKMRINAERWLQSGDQQKVADATKLLEALDELPKSERRKLYHKLKGLPVSRRVAEAFTDTPPTDTEERVIRALMENPGASSEELSNAIGWEGTAWNLHFGTMCKQREAYLWPAEKHEGQDASFFTGILADVERVDDAWRFSMKADVAEAFAELGIGGKFLRK